MRVMFVYGAFENLGIEYLSAVLKSHHHTTRLALDPLLFDDPFLRLPPLARFFDHQKSLIREIAEFGPGLLAFSVPSCYYKKALSLANAVKRILPSVHVTFGGIHPTAVPETVLENDCVDSVVLGEGEYPLLELADCLGRGRLDTAIRNIWFRQAGGIVKNPVRPYISNLDELPYPDKGLYYDILPRYRKGYTVITRRGCTGGCSYCCLNVWHALYPGQPRIRIRGIENVIRELREAKERYNFTQLRINDDLFTYDKNWLRDFAKEYKRHIGTPVWCFTSPAYVDEEVVRSLEKMSCRQVCLGIQSPVRALRERILHRYVDNEKNTRAIQLLKAAGIRCLVDTIMGFPGETEDDLVETARYYNETRPDRICIFWLIYYPRTPLVEMAKGMGVLDETQCARLECEPTHLANTIPDRRRYLRKIQFHWLLLLIHFVPRRWGKWFIDKRAYRFLPKWSPSPLEALFTAVARDRLDIPRKRYYVRYWHFMKKRFSREHIFPKKDSVVSGAAGTRR
ncbi:MAG TPA: radical SAM protein [Elusimicrobiota bacterium]|nr:radical SAM protein [Elusimicrobiota bacterium]